MRGPSNFLADTWRKMPAEALTTAQSMKGCEAQEINNTISTFLEGKYKKLGPLNSNLLQVMFPCAGSDVHMTQGPCRTLFHGITPGHLNLHIHKSIKYIRLGCMVSLAEFRQVGSRMDRRSHGWQTGSDDQVQGTESISEASGTDCRSYVPPQSWLLTCTGA